MRKPIEINNKSSLYAQHRDILKKDRRAVKSGYPRPAPLQTIEEIRDYLAQEEDIDCLICGRRLKSLSAHLSRIHRMSADDYKSLYGLPFGRGLTCEAMTRKLREHGQAMAAAQTPEQREKFLNTKPEGKARVSGLKKLCAEKGLGIIDSIPRENLYERADAERMLEQIEQGKMLSEVADKDGAMSVTTFRELLGQNQDLQERYRAVAGASRKERLKVRSNLDGKRSRGSDCPKSKLTEDKVREIRTLLSAGRTRYEIAKLYSVSWDSVDSISSGKSWGWLK